MLAATGWARTPSPLTGTSCDDGNQCTSDVCAAGVCIGTNLADNTGCDDGNECTAIDVCTAGACGGTAVANDTPCDDGSLCTLTDSCQGGRCSGADPAVCTASDTCHDVGTCAPGTGLCSNPRRTEGAACDDGDVCTGTSYCTFPYGDPGICWPSTFRALYVDVTGSDGGNDCTDQTAPCATIQHGVDQGCRGATVYVGAGTYRENVVVSETVGIQGAGQGVTIVEPAVSGPDCGGAGGGDPLCSGASSVFLVEAAAYPHPLTWVQEQRSVRIRDLTVDGDNPHLSSGVVRGGADVDARNGIITNHLLGAFSLEVSDVAVQNVYLRGMQGSSGTVHIGYSTLRNVQGDDEYSIALAARDNPFGEVDIDGNTISDASEAVNVTRSLDASVINNTVTRAGVGLHVDTGLSSAVYYNRVADCMPLLRVPSGAGIVMSTPGPFGSVHANSVTNCAIGLAQYGWGGTYFSSNYVDGSSMPGSIGALVSTDLQAFGSSDASAVFYYNDLLNNATGLAVEEQAGYTARATGSNNTITGNRGSGVDAGVGEAVLTCNMIADNGTGVTAASASVEVHGNAVMSNGVGTDGSLVPVGSVSATDNWWGCVAGPGNPGCDVVTSNVDVLPVASAVPSCVVCGSDADCDDHVACNGVEACYYQRCYAAVGPTCTLPTGTDPRCNAPACTEPAGTCAVVQSPDGTPCNTGDTCQQGVCTGANALMLGQVRLRHNGSAKHADGLAAIYAQVNDRSTGGALMTDLMAGKVTVETYDGAAFQMKVPLTKCHKTQGGGIRCRDKASGVLATLSPVNRLSAVFGLRVVQQHLDSAHTGTTKPSGPVRVILRQDLVERSAQLAASRCKPSGGMLVCAGS